MNFTQEDRQAICDIFERLLREQAGESKLRETIASEQGFDRDLWQKIAELGLAGILISTADGGSGGSVQEVEALMEVAGEYLFNGPFIESCVIAPTLLAACDETELCAPHLQKIAAGHSIVTVAGCGQSGDWTLPPEVEAEQQAQGWRLNGEAHFVSYADIADHCLVRARVPDGIAVFLVAMDEPGIADSLHSANDRTQRLSTLILNDVSGEQLAGVGTMAWGQALNKALVALAGEQVGGSQHIFALTMDYLKTRHQFGQPIGRFQALKHMAADLLVELESATSVARHAARQIAAHAEDSEQMSYLAGFTCADNFRRISADAIQLHGGIAYTVEHPAHLYWRRAQSGQWLYCSSDRLRDLYLSAMEVKL